MLYYNWCDRLLRIIHWWLYSTTKGVRGYRLRFAVPTRGKSLLAMLSFFDVPPIVLPQAAFNLRVEGVQDECEHKNTMTYTKRKLQCNENYTVNGQSTKRTTRETYIQQSDNVPAKQTDEGLTFGGDTEAKQTEADGVMTDGVVVLQEGEDLTTGANECKFDMYRCNNMLTCQFSQNEYQCEGETNGSSQLCHDCKQNVVRFF